MSSGVKGEMDKAMQLLAKKSADRRTLGNKGDSGVVRSNSLELLESGQGPTQPLVTVMLLGRQSGVGRGIVSRVTLRALIR